jgi:teichuronic acid biosynthesis glycosyltransferase TuaC
MKILYFTSSFPEKSNTSTGIFIYNRVKKLIENNIDVEVIKYYTNPITFHKLHFLFKKNDPSYNTGEFDFLPGLNINVVGINKFYIPKTNLSCFLTGKLKDYFFKNNFDIIHSHFAWDSYIPFLLKKKYGIRYVMTAHGSDIHTIPYKSNFMLKRTVEILENAEKVIFVSEFLLSKAKEFGYSGKNGIVIPNGIDFEKFRVIENNPVILKKKNEKLVGFVGSLNYVKRAEFLPEIFHEISLRDDNTRFLIIGKGELNEEIMVKIKALNINNKVKIYSNLHSNKMPEYMNNFDCLILPSRAEGWGCVITEAMACGVQIAGSRAGGIPEAIGDCGITVPESENFAVDFAEAVIKLLKNPVKESRLKQWALNFDINNTIKAEIEVYKGIR